MKIIKSASAQWKGSVKDGGGSISTESGSLDQQPYGFNTRFEGTPGTNPEELIAAAHAACFAMALTVTLAKEDITPASIRATGKVTLEQQGEAFTITRSDIEVSVEAGDADPDIIRDAIDLTAENCPVSKLLNAERSVKVEIPA